MTYIPSKPKAPCLDNHAILFGKMFQGTISKNLQEKLKERLDAVSIILPELGHIVLGIQKGDLQIQSKSAPMDLVTRADFKSEEILLDFIQSNFPDDEILAEEGGASKRSTSSGLTWILDPIDGTINFAHGLPLFAISIGLAWEERPVAGLVYLPALGDLYRAIKGGGSYKNGIPIQVSQNRDLSKSLVVTGFPYSRADHMPALLQTIERILSNARGLRRTGSAALDLCWLAEGRFDVHYELYLNPWDTCAGVVIVEEAGGKVTDLVGDPWNLWQPGLAASNGHVHEALLPCLRALGRHRKD